MNLKGRSFLKLKDFTSEEIKYLIELSADLKAKKKKGAAHDVFKGKNIALIFEKTSTRTRCSFEVAAYDLGMHVTYLDPSGSQIGKKESIADTARVLGRMFDGIEYRGFGQEIVEELAKYAGVPVWNGLTNEFHPTQMIADMLTVQENIAYPLGLTGQKKGNWKERVNEILEDVGLDKTMRKKYPGMLSGGEQQRVAIARTIASGAPIILADEPTGNLDTANSKRIVDNLKKLSREDGRCVILVTHDPDIARQADILYRMSDGQIAEEHNRTKKKPEDGCKTIAPKDE